MKRDLKADLKSIQEGRTLFDDPDPSVGTKYELYEVAEHAIERAIKAEALARELVEALGNHALFSTEERTLAEWDECEKRLEEVYLRAKEVLGDVSD